MRRRAPRPLAAALQAAAAEAAPVTLLARVQAAWEAAAGERVSMEATPVEERDGVVTVACRSSLWAHELELLSPDLTARLNAALGPGMDPPPVRRLKFLTRAGP